MFLPPPIRLVLSAFALGGLLLAHGLSAEADVSFSRDIRPILSENCYKCHGPDEKARKAKLRLDTRDGAIAVRDDVAAIVPGDAAASELLKRLESTDPDEVMPPPKERKKITPAQVATLHRWIESGAKWGKHWAYEPPQSSALPSVKLASWPRNEIDRFVLTRLEKEGLAPSAPAEKSTLLRRVSLDLTGLPPAPDELTAFLSDTAPDAYEQAVDRLLASPHFGERMASDWLDAARYSDTNGYFRDNARQAWPWRDWVINAFNRNLPYDRFTIEQLAGDLLPNATLDQKVATGFNRNHMVSGESGIIDEEYRVEYVADRTETTATVWMGTTLGCARCHDHKYDPFSQREFYQFFSFFNNGPDTGLVKEDDPPPTLDVSTPAQRTELAQLTEKRKAAEARFEQLAAPFRSAMPAWERDAVAELPVSPSDHLALYCDFEERLTNAACDPEQGTTVGTPVKFEPGLLGSSASFDGLQHVEFPAAIPLEADAPWTIGVWIRGEGSLNCLLSKVEENERRRGFELLWQKGHIQANLVSTWGANAIELATKAAIRANEWHQVIAAYDGSRKAAGLRLYIDGEPAEVNVGRDSLDGGVHNDAPLRVGRRGTGLGFHGRLDELRIVTRSLAPDQAHAWYEAEQIRGVLATAADKRDPHQKSILLDFYLQRHADGATQEARQIALAARETEDAFRKELPTTLVMQERPEPRVAHVLERGQYDHPGAAVTPGVPASLSPMPADAPPNRLGLAQWLTSPAHPLTARVEVNRLWQQCFGEGLVRTVNDFGSQGEAPTHPELLDSLAVRFMKSGWDIKQLLRLIVTSATYRQSSAATSALLQRDPENRMLARGPRFRLSAEMVRDQALASAGLLVPKIGGPSVKPYQPAGLWEAVSYDGELSYQRDSGEGLWRRSLYTFWKRQSPPPALLAFDGPTRETCTVRRARTNTPLQALVLLNDETYVEAARVLAARSLAESAQVDARLAHAFQRVLARQPSRAEIDTLRHLLEKQEARFASNPAAARDLIAIGISPLGRDRDPVELASYTVAAQAILNLDETITRR